MNTYNENLQQTVINTLAALSARQSQLASAQTAAQYSLYYAQGAEITARDKLTATNKTVVFCQSVNDQSLINDNQATNLFATVTAANTSVSASNTNMATAASNVQIASNAIAMLASDIGAALNIATASLFNTDSYKKILDANNFVNDVANDSKNVSMLAMDASGRSSEIIATALLAQTNTVTTKTDNLLAATQTELNKFSELSISEYKVVSQTAKAEQLAEGALLDADKEASAIVRAYANANDRLNLGLSVSVNSGTQISVAFSALPSPLPTFLAQPASGIAIPGANPNYYLTLVPADKMVMFSTDQAEQLFASRLPEDKTQFYPLTPNPKGSSVVLVNDAFNSPIQAGSSYVAFLYIALSMEYKRFIGNFSDLLSAPGQTFIPATTLPLAKKCTDKLSADVLASLDASAIGSLCFTAESMVSAAAGKAGGAAIDLIKVIGQAAGVDVLSAYSGAIGSSTEQYVANALITDENVLKKAKLALLAVAPSTDLWYADACEVAIDTLSAAYYATVADTQGTAEDDVPKAAGQAEANAIAASLAAERVVVAVFPSGVDAATISAAVFAASKAAATVADAAALVVNIEFRCILIESGKQPDLDLMLSPANHNPPIYFNRDLALQIAPANYVLAIDKPAEQAVKGAKKGKEGTATALPTDPNQQERIFVVVFDPNTTDNFGSMIQPDKTYQPYILTTVNGSSRNQYLSVLSGALDPLNVFNKKDEQVNQ
jgi:hypothetical protein